MAISPDENGLNGQASSQFAFEPVPPADPPAPQQRPLSAWEVRPRVLVADPAAAISLVLRAWLQAHGYRVAVEESLVGALAACRRDPPHLLIAYRSIRGGTAQQLVLELRRDPLLRRIALIYVTALDDNRDILAALGAGADDYHQIPFDVDRLYEQIRALLAHTQGWLLPPSTVDFRPGL